MGFCDEEYLVEIEHRGDQDGNFIISEGFPAEEFTRRFAMVYMSDCRGRITLKQLLMFIQVQLNVPELLINNMTSVNMLVQTIADAYLLIGDVSFLSVVKDSVTSVSLWEWAQIGGNMRDGKFDQVLDGVKNLMENQE